MTRALKHVINNRPYEEIQAEIRAVTEAFYAANAKRREEDRWIEEQVKADPGFARLSRNEQQRAIEAARRRQAREAEPVDNEAYYRRSDALEKERRAHPDDGRSLTIYIRHGEMRAIEDYLAARGMEGSDDIRQFVVTMLREGMRERHIAPVKGERTR
jgi:hypothetical protein